MAHLRDGRLSGLCGTDLYVPTNREKVGARSSVLDTTLCWTACYIKWYSAD